ncbi:MAG: hypothetical protein ACOX01_05535 [Methanobrevibacter boviskoreani]|uniref:hypothetical protein n=1 Tax=Methanobrevibacter boviskoreani TaxID=1348249 RepID=UPI003D8A8BEA
MEINKKDALKLMEEIKHSEIDVEKTIEKVCSSDLADFVEMEYCVSCLDDDNFDKSRSVINL